MEIYTYAVILNIVCIFQQELGTNGSGVFSTLEQWNAVKNKATYTSMALGLLVAVFDSNTLLKSNQKGGKSKIKSEENVQYTALDSKKIDAIKGLLKNYQGLLTNY